MFAVVRTGGKQYRVALGDKIVVEKLDGNAGDRIQLGEVLLAGEGSDLKSTDGLLVAAEIIAQAKGDKVTVFKKRRRHNYRRKKGHRQQHTILRIVGIGDQKEDRKRAPAKTEEPLAPAARPSAPPPPPPAQAPKGPAKVNETPTENPAPDNPQQANPPTQKPAAKAAKSVKAAATAPAAEAAAPADTDAAQAPSTENAAPAKGASKAAPKAATKKTPKAK